jgi:pyruvoyl-dependent arginine decarboxylase (PvlArgDC)
MNESDFPRGIPVMLARRMFLTTGFGRDKEHKNARDHASDPAGVADLTLIAGTSALPPGIRDSSAGTSSTARCHRWSG